MKQSKGITYTDSEEEMDRWSEIMVLYETKIFKERAGEEADLLIQRAVELQNKK